MESLERKEEAGESMNEFVDRYINLYFNKSITKCVADAIQTSRLFLGGKLAIPSTAYVLSLAEAMSVVGDNNG